MHWGRAGALIACVPLLALGCGAAAQDAAAPGDAAAPVTQAEAAVAAPTGPKLLPKLSPVAIEILDPLGSKTSRSLGTFRIALAEPLTLDGAEVVPAGIPGMGEIVHAKKAGGMGAAGELVIAARYLDLDGRKLRLRSTVLDAEGKSRINGVNTLAVASAASPIPIAVVGFFIKGGDIEVPAGTRAVAKLAEDFALDALTAPAPENPAAMDRAAGDNGGNTQ
jgi:hypothetical protein